MHLRSTPLFLLLACCICDAAAPQATPQVEANRLVAMLRNPATPFDEKTKCAEQLLALADEGPKRLAPLARSEFINRRAAYGARFEKAAGDVLKGRLKGDVVREVESLRQQIQSISKAADLSKDMIVTKADPALKRLEELLAVAPEQVTESSAELQKQRGELLAWAGWAVAAMEKVPEADRKNLPTLDELKALQPEFEESESLMALVSCPMTPEDRRVLIANVPLAKQLDPEEAAGILYLNQLRLRIGLNAQAIDPKLVAAARDHSKEMVEKKYFDHRSPTPGHETFSQRAKLAGASAAAENIYNGPSKGESAIKGWWHSPGHHKNMMGGYKRVGLGRSGGMWTQMFG